MTYKEKIVDAETGEVTWRDYTAKEIAEVENFNKEMAEKVAAIEARQKSRESALAKLAALGLTEDEIAAL